MPSTARYPQRRPITMVLFLALLSLLSSCQASAGLRGGRELNLIQNNGAGTGSRPANCNHELSFNITCQGDCNFTAHKGTCESKMFMYHGGPCRSALATTRSVASSDSAANCHDFHQGPPSDMGEEVFVVISDAQDASKNSSMWTEVGGFFWTDYRDYPIGLGLSDQQNITVYSSNETSYDNMLQTMVFYSPCEGIPLEHLDADQSVQLFATAVDPQIRALFHLHIQSQTPQTWQLKTVSVITAANGGPAEQEELVLSNSTTTVGDVEIPVLVEFGRDNKLVVLSSASLITASGLECGVSALYTANPGNNPNPRNSITPRAMWP